MGRRREQAADIASERKYERFNRKTLQSMFKEQKETIIREVNAGMMTISY